MDERTIADALGQKTLEMARHYAKGADLKPKMRGVVSSISRRNWTNGEQKLSTPTD